jgi:hypothetical protein
MAQWVVHGPAFYGTTVVDPASKGGVTGVATARDLEATESAAVARLLRVKSHLIGLI